MQTGAALLLSPYTCTIDETTDMATTFGSPAARADQTLAWNMQLIGHHELAGVDVTRIGTGMSSA